MKIEAEDGWPLTIWVKKGGLSSLKTSTPCFPRVESYVFVSRLKFPIAPGIFLAKKSQRLDKP
jgi:hypothetical protein